MTLKSIIVLVCSVSVFSLFSQPKPESYTIIQYPGMPEGFVTLNKKMNETSGLIFFDNSAWTFNDSGGKPEIYRVNPDDGKIAQKLIIENADNKDWEDITQDDDYIYIGDFGNNAGNRKDLKIYKVKKDQLDDGKNITVSAEIISFKYTDQKSFTVNYRKHDFDCESVISYKDRLLLFSKNWENGKTKMYSLSKAPGDYTISTKSGFDVNGLITGADYCEENNKLVFIGYENYENFIYLFQDFNGDILGTEEVYRINIIKLKNAQSEGICFFDKNTILISTEKTDHFEQQIFKLNVDQVFQYSGLEYD